MTDIHYAHYPGVRALFLIVSLLVGCFVQRQSFADVPLPPRITNPVSVEEAWNVIRLAMANVTRLLKDGRVEEVTDQIALCSPSLRVLAQVQPADGGVAGRDELSARAFRSVNLMAQNVTTGNLEGARSVFLELKKTIGSLIEGLDKKYLEAEVHHCLSHGDVISLQSGQSCTVCNLPLVPRRIPYSFVYVEQEKPVVKLIREDKQTLSKGKDARVLFRLQTGGGKPVTPADLVMSHTQPLHVFLVSPGASGLKWVIPEHREGGRFEFSFSPSSGGLHQIWVAVIPSGTGLQEYLSMDLACEGDQLPAQEARPGMSAKTEKLQLDLSLAGERRGGVRPAQLQMLHLNVNDASGQPLARLEPWMTAYVHIAAVSEDQKTFFQLHPMGGDILQESARGGPRLSFKIYPPRPGFMRLFCFLKLDGQTLTVPLGMEVRP
jgi:hypothetical protein